MSIVSSINFWRRHRKHPSDARKHGFNTCCCNGTRCGPLYAEGFGQTCVRSARVAYSIRCAASGLGNTIERVTDAVRPEPARGNQRSIRFLAIPGNPRSFRRKWAKPTQDRPARRRQRLIQFTHRMYLNRGPVYPRTLRQTACGIFRHWKSAAELISLRNQPPDCDGVTGEGIFMYEDFTDWCADHGRTVAMVPVGVSFLGCWHRKHGVKYARPGCWPDKSNTSAAWYDIRLTGGLRTSKTYERADKARRGLSFDGERCRQTFRRGDVQ